MRYYLGTNMLVFLLFEPDSISKKVALLSAKSFCEVKIRAGFLVWNSALFGYLWIAKIKNDNHEQKYTF